MATTRVVISEEDVDAVGFGDATHEKVETLLRWVRDTERFELAPSVPADYPLAMASDFLMQLGDLEAAWHVAAEAERDPRADPYRTLANLVEVRLRQGRADDARELTNAARADPDVDPLIVEQIGELFERYDLPRDALRWFTIGIRLLESAGAADTLQYDVFCTARFRVRRDAGMPWDMFDRDDVRSQEIFEVSPPE